MSFKRGGDPTPSGVAAPNPFPEEKNFSTTPRRPDGFDKGGKGKRVKG